MAEDMKPGVNSERDPASNRHGPKAWAPQTAAAITGASARYMRCSAIICMATGIKQVGASKAKNQAPQNPHAGHRRNAVAVAATRATKSPARGRMLATLVSANR